MIPTSSKSTYTNWKDYFAAGQTALTTTSFTEIYANVKAGYNLIMFYTPIDVNQNTLVSWSTEPGNSNIKSIFSFKFLILNNDNKGSGRIALDLNGANYNDFFYSGTTVSALSSTGKFTQVIFYVLLFIG